MQIFPFETVMSSLNIIKRSAFVGLYLTNALLYPFTVKILELKILSITL